ncbi:SH3 beta-barrel fold-containing protein [Xylanibacter ruminicola]|uniref:SH3 beta-barrel fold-containing protein n=1 Tax=Xylanibacter ruminicola TaxID=839 RepID=UPI000691A0D4|nr:SH3 beta-barrel fold-containing protein [Xylanibacter ruminicola]
MKQISTVSTNEIARYAAKNIVLNHVDMLTATSKGIALETMKKRMMRGEVVRFAYMKKDGSVRVAVGTLQPQAVEANVKGTGIPKKYYGMFAYLDLEKMSWRGFKEERFIGTIEN